jgi:ribokinase
MPKILNIGSINLDEVFTVEHFVAPGETIGCRSYVRNFGGKGNNQSTALARAGADVHHAGKVGPDGEEAVDRLRAAGADVSRIAVMDEPTGRAIIQVDPAGQNCILLHGGANRTITGSDIDGFLCGWGRGDALLLQNEVSGTAYALEAASRLGLRTFLNPSPVDDTFDRIPLELVDCLILNEIEASAIGGQPLTGASPETLIASLRTRFPRADIVLTLGPAGAYFEGVNGIRLIAQAMRVNAVDTTAAGDTFTGYFIASILRGEAPDVAMKEATTAAGICVTRPGAVNSIPHREEL